MNINSMQRQSGHAAILFALMIPVLFGVFALGTDGARAVQDKARLLEAVEVASLAVAGQGSDNKVLAKSYLQYYFPLAKINDADITINKINCEDNAACKGQDRRFFEYQVSAHITQPTWFPGNDAIIGFGKNYQVFDRSVTRKYHAKTVDVIFVADFSGSMVGVWDGKVKYKALIEVIKDVNKDLLKFNDILASSRSPSNNAINRAAFTAYDYNTIMYDGESYCNLNHYKSSVNKTIDAIFQDKHCPESKLNNPPFFRVPITSDFTSKIDNIIKDFKPRRGTTASYQGLIDAAYIAYSIPNPNPRQLIIILSDGEDFPQGEADKMTGLVNANMCKGIVKKLESRQFINAANRLENVKARLAMIAFDYNQRPNSGLTRCIESDNIFSANDFEAIKNKILELITEEIGHLAPQR
ncbi:TadE/TadG family type IV pilus assembly protein [Vibrio metschnikovii]|uniref:TadE/TadG family type IV pilus assembly protein n=1 Tax=Vibrio metschnikovii TaxID=28172 RepID=UPI001C2F6963|nr:TadE/TadG family type IV pilus assembly protein [Vibrio metschnikovii]